MFKSIVIKARANDDNYDPVEVTLETLETLTIWKNTISPSNKIEAIVRSNYRGKETDHDSNETERPSKKLFG